MTYQCPGPAREHGDPLRDHGLGVPGYYDQPMFASGGSHAQRLAATIAREPSAPDAGGATGWGWDTVQPGEGRPVNPNNCDTCDHKRDPDGGHCYMFREAPTEVCMQHTGRAATMTWGQSMLTFALAVNGRTSMRLDEEERQRKQGNGGGGSDG